MPLPRSSLAACLAGLAVLAAPAQAQTAGDWRIALGGGASRGNTDCVAAFACDHSDSYLKGTLAWRAWNALDLQLTRFNGATFKGGNTTDRGTDFGGDFKVSGVGLLAAWRWSLAPQWTLDGRAGVARVRTNFAYAAPFAVNGSRRKGTTQPMAGGSLGYAVAPAWRVSIDLDVTRFEAYRSHGSLRMVGAAVEYTF